MEMGLPPSVLFDEDPEDLAKLKIVMEAFQKRRELDGARKSGNASGNGGEG